MGCIHNKWKIWVLYGQTEDMRAITRQLCVVLLQAGSFISVLSSFAHSVMMFLGKAAWILLLIKHVLSPDVDEDNDGEAVGGAMNAFGGVGASLQQELHRHLEETRNRHQYQRRQHRSGQHRQLQQAVLVPMDPKKGSLHFSDGLFLNIYRYI